MSDSNKPQVEDPKHESMARKRSHSVEHAQKSPPKRGVFGSKVKRVLSQFQRSPKKFAKKDDGKFKVHIPQEDEFPNTGIPKMSPPIDPKKSTTPEDSPDNSDDDLVPKIQSQESTPKLPQRRNLVNYSGSETEEGEIQSPIKSIPVINSRYGSPAAPAHPYPSPPQQYPKMNMTGMFNWGSEPGFGYNMSRAQMRTDLGSSPSISSFRPNASFNSSFSSPYGSPSFLDTSYPPYPKRDSISSRYMRDYATELSEIYTLDKQKYRLYDTHCHLDFLFKRSDFNGNLSSYRMSRSEEFPECFAGCVAVFCQPNTFSKEMYWKRLLEDENVYGAFGCHPHYVKDMGEADMWNLRRCLQHRNVRALGEIGLDYSLRNNCNKDLQHEWFKKQLAVAIELQLPLVIHSRDATQDTLEIMKKIVPPDYRIHCHCFGATITEARLWLEAYPKVLLGFTNLVTYSSAVEIHKVVTELPMERILLETDAPYFVPRLVPKPTKFAHPGMVAHVAAQIAALRSQQTVEDVIKQTASNTEWVYRLS